MFFMKKDVIKPIERKSDVVPLGRKKTRKPYHRPSLGSLGDLRDLTIGFTTGVGESGMTSTHRLMR
jgi:hypothetical protein